MNPKRSRSNISSACSTPILRARASPLMKANPIVELSEPFSLAPKQQGGSVAGETATHKKPKKKKKSEDKESEPIVPIHKSEATLSDLKQFFSRVEMFFQIESDKNKRSNLFPNDIGNLLLWSVPSPTPVISSPVIFSFKNKSKIREVLVIYVNGWSYDMMMCTGVGLERSKEESASGGEPKENVWSEKVCSTLLKPIRCNQCWARPEAAVQYLPLYIPNMSDSLETDIFWRNDYPKVLRSFAAHGHHRSHGGDHDKKDGATEVEMIDVAQTSPHYSKAAGVGDRFKAALEIHRSNPSSPASGNANVDSLPTTPANEHPPETGAVVENKDKAKDETNDDGAIKSHHEQEDKKADLEKRKEVWYNVALLQEMALQMEKDRELMIELGFTLDAPNVDDGEHTSETKNDEGASPMLCDKEAWSKFSTSKKHYQKYKQKEHQEQQQAGAKDEPPRNPYTSYTKSVPTIFALDCEMVLVGQRVSALARATLIDVLSKEVVMDVLVRPKDPVTDYLTRYSGITEDMLNGTIAKENHENNNGDEPLAVVSFEECQQILKRFVHTDTYIVGHSLENDFKALKMIPNCFILDSAQLYPHPSGLPYKNALRFLAMRYLHKKIQQGAHDSSIDALTSAELVYLKLLKGPSFGVRQKISVLELIAWNGASPAMLAAEVGSSNNDKTVGTKAADGESEPDVLLSASGDKIIPTHVQLFDDAAALSRLMPKRKMCRHNVIEPINCRHDEDTTRKVVKSLEARRNAVKTEDDTDAASFHLVWAQLSTDTQVDVLQRSGEEYVGEEGETYEETQLRKAELTNGRVMRMVEAAADGTVILVIAGDCKGAKGGNQFSRAQGACFGFVKDAVSGKPPVVSASVAVDEKKKSGVAAEEEQKVQTTKNSSHSTPPPKECQQQ